MKIETDQYTAIVSTQFLESLLIRISELEQQIAAMANRHAEEIRDKINALKSHGKRCSGLKAEVDRLNKYVDQLAAAHGKEQTRLTSELRAAKCNNEALIERNRELANAAVSP